ncbi:unnamed protein product, partial [Didymodactylos carnosus]
YLLPLLEYPPLTGTFFALGVGMNYGNEHELRKQKVTHTRTLFAELSDLRMNSYENKHVHQRQNCEPYEALFTKAKKSLSLEQVIDSDIWNWKTVEKLSSYQTIWNAHETWKKLSHLIFDLKEPVRIISNPERCWILLIDKYQHHQEELMKLPILLSKTVFINYLPNSEEIQKLKTIFDKYDQEEEPSVFSKLQNNDQRTQSGNYYLFDSTITNKYINKNDFYFPIQNPPSQLSNNKCCACKKAFSFFARRHFCRMCGQDHCTDCSLYKRIPHLGYITKSVRICSNCSEEKKQLIYQHLFNYVKNLIESNRLELLSIFLALLDRYQPDSNRSFYHQTGIRYYQAEKYSLALQCFTYARLDNDEWFKYSIEFCKKNEYSYCFTCMKLCNKSDNFWLQQATLQHNSIYALLCYERIKLSIEKIFQIASDQFFKDTDTCLFYLLYLNVKYADQVDWKDFGGKTLLERKDNGSLAMFCFYLYDKMLHDEWIYVSEQLCDTNQFEKLALLLTYLYCVQKIDLQISTNSYIYFLTKILLSKKTTISLDDWLNHFCNISSVDMNRIIIGLSFAHIYKYRSWIEYKNQYIEKKEYLKVLFCHKMAETLCDRNETRWFINAIEDFDPIGYELFNNTNQISQWKQLADQYYNDQKFLIALNCYLFCEQEKAYETIIQQAQSSTLPLSTALLYLTVVFKLTRGCSSKNSHVLPLVISAVQMYETEDRFKNIDLFKYHLLILNQLAKMNDKKGENDPMINGGVHILLSMDRLSNESMQNLTALNQPLLIKLQTKVFNQLKVATYKSCLELMKVLFNSENYFLEQLKQVLQNCCGILELEDIQPSEYRSKMYFIQAIIYKLENNPIQSLSSIHHALLSHPYDTVIISLLFFINFSYTHSTIRRALIDDIINNSLNLSDITPPIHLMKNLTFLKRTERLIMLKKYERAIIKRLAENNPVQAAFSYIDLIMAISGNRTLFANSLTMSCLYFYKAMTNPKCTSAELYAYRSIIFDISIEIFLFTRHYLPLYVQMYIYKMLYTIILRSSDLFSKRNVIINDRSQTLKNEPIINDYHETVLDELLKNILHLSQVNPLTHSPSTSTIHDMVYMECAGNEFLSKYLKFKSFNRSLYQYYYFEGIWKGWIDNDTFTDEREICMEALLHDNNWIMDDVQDLLCWSVIPKTNDGWFLNTQHRLRLGQSAYSQVIGITLNNDTGDIEFLFTKAKKNEHNLFDAADVVDVLTNGIDFAYFTLDPPNANYHSHPFNEMRYLPRRLENIPNYLLTLLHTDYLLKMISTGVEICSLIPFEMRSSTDNLMQRLPIKIREELQAIAVKKSGMITDSIRRFWIQPESTLDYEQIFHKNFFGRTNDNITHVYLSDNFKMCVKQHRMKYDEKGNLIDDKNDTQDDQSAEAQFSRVFTKYYDEIGEYFPELLRLKELVKLNFLSRIIRARYESQRDLAARIENNSAIDTHLKEMKRTIGRYPTGSDENDKKILNALLKNLSKQCFCKKSALRPYIIDWLEYNDEQALVQYLKQSIIQEKAKLKFTIEKLNFFYDDTHDNDQKMSNDLSKCSWVPAAFSIDLNMKVYGGVLAAADGKEVPGIAQMQKSKPATKENASKVSANDHSRRNDMRIGGTAGGDNNETGTRSNFSTNSYPTRQEALNAILTKYGLSEEAKPYEVVPVLDTNPDMKQKSIEESKKTGEYITAMVDEIFYELPDGFLILRQDTERTYNERRKKGSTDTSGAQKAHFNVLIWTLAEPIDTKEHYYFDRDERKT